MYMVELSKSYDSAASVLKSTNYMRSLVTAETGQNKKHLFE